MGSKRVAAVLTSAAVACSVAVGAAPATAAVGGSAAALSPAKDNLAPLLKSRELVAGDTWRQTVRVRGYKQIKLQIRQGSGPFRTVKTYRVPKNGRVKLSRTFPTPGQFAMRSIAVRAGKGRPVKGRPFIITAVAKRYRGTFGGEHTSGTSWNGSLTYFYQQRDPFTNQPWSDGDVHYTGVEGSVTWNFDASVLNADTGVIGRARRNCAASPSTGQIPLEALDANMTVAREVERAKGRRYRVSAFVQQAPRIQYTCEYLDLDDDLNEIWVPETRELSLQFGPNIGDLLTNALSVAATGEAGQYTKSLDAAVVGDINRPVEAVTNRWFWNLSAS